MTMQRTVVGTAAQADKALAELNARQKAAAEHPHAAALLNFAPRAKLEKLTLAEVRELRIPDAAIKAILEASK